jgi:hypothetical protein
MIKRLFLPGIVCALVLLDIFLLYENSKNCHLAEESRYLIQRLQNEITEKQQIIDDICNTEIIELTNLNGNNCNDSVLKIEKDYNQHLFVYRFSSASCNSCIDSMLVLIKNSSDKLKRNILIVSDDNTKNALHVRLHYAGLDQTRYAVSEKLSFTFDACKTPYCFVLDSNMVASMFFIPHSRNRKRTLDYLNFITTERLN